MEKIKSKRETLLFRGHVNSPFSSCSSTWRDWSFSKARIREAKEHHLVSLSGVHLQVVKGAPCRAGWIRCFTDFPSSSPSLLLSQSVNENNSLNQTFGSCLSHVWIGAIRGKAAFLQTRESGNVLTQEPRYHPPPLSITRTPHPCVQVSSHSTELCPRFHTPASAELSTWFRATFPDLGAQGEHFRFHKRSAAVVSQKMKKYSPHDKQ